ncbi:MAG TPA: helix-turn-helix transcriptional regulator [Vineibacter sp.]|nr:helix-turn-helix transcriptional regulator [Vineibacter sp.]
MKNAAGVGVIEPFSRHEVLEIAGLIQDAALDPPRWQDVLMRLVRQLDGIAGGMWLNDPVRSTAVPIAHTGLDPSYTDRYSQHFLFVDPVFRIKSRLPVGRAVSTSILMRLENFTRTEFYNDWFRPQGFHDAVGAAVYRHTGRFTWLSIVRPKGTETTADEVAAFAGLVPHMVRSLNVAHRLDVLADQQKALRDGLAAITHAVMLVDRHGRLVFANAAAEALLESRQSLTVRRGRVEACDAAIDADLQAALARALSDAQDDHRGVTELAVPRRGLRPLVLSIVPASEHTADRLDMDRRVAALILAADPRNRPWSRLEGVILAYGLTPAEGKVLDALIDGDRLDEAAERLGIRRATAKTHLNRILAKTGTTRQSELVRLVAGTLPPLRG